MKAIVLISVISYCVISNAQAQQTSPEKFAEFIPLYPKGKMPNSKGMNLKESIANERIYRVGTQGMYAFFPSAQENKGAAVLICPGDMNVLRMSSAEPNSQNDLMQLVSVHLF